MNRRQFKAQASSGRAGNGGFGGFSGSVFGATSSSVLSYVQEPPDFSGIHDAQIIVAFKNLSKKDGTTKSKALEDIQKHVSETDIEIEDGLLEVWGKLFPRLSIDTSRRVRQLSHALNGMICSKCGKRTVNFLPRLTGPWLAGTHDNDRAVSKAANDALQLVFPTAEKVQGLQRTFQRAILEYCRDAALHETKQTLSDERAVTPEDAEATFVRVVSCALSVLSSMVRGLPVDELFNNKDFHEEILRQDRLWTYVHHSDPSIRRSCHKLIRTYLEIQPCLLEDRSEDISSAYLYKGLVSDQTGSSVDFVMTILALTRSLPSIWTVFYTGKKPVTNRLRQFLENGSRGAPINFWNHLVELFQNIPEQILPKTKDEALELANAAKNGVSRREERLNASYAWPAYFAMLNTMMKGLSDDDRKTIIEKQVMPIIPQYLEPNTGDASWSITDAKAAEVISQIVTVQSALSVLLSTWWAQANNLIEIAKASQPEQAKDFDNSQKFVAAVGERWSRLQQQFFTGRHKLSQETLTEFHKINLKIFHECSSLLRVRNGKPYGSASIIADILRTCASQLLEDDGFRKASTDFVENDGSVFIFSPSQRYFVNALYTLHLHPMFSKIFSNILRDIIDANQGTDSKLGALRAVFTQSIPNVAIEIVRNSHHVQGFVAHLSSSAPPTAFLPLIVDLIRLDALPATATDDILSGLTRSLSITDRSAASLDALDSLAKANETVIRGFISSSRPVGKQLLPNIVQLEQSDDDTLAEKATSLASRLSSVLDNAPSGAKYNILLQNLEQVSTGSLPMDSLHDLCARLLRTKDEAQPLIETMPRFDVWKNSLVSVMTPPKASLALLSPLGGAVHTVEPDRTTVQEVQYDSQGLSQALRIAMYVTRLLANTDEASKFDDTKCKALVLLHISVLVAEDNLSVLGTNGMWTSQSNTNVEPMVLDFTADANSVLTKSWNSCAPGVALADSSGYTQLVDSLEELQRSVPHSSPLAYYIALSFAKLHDNLFELHSHSSEQARHSEDGLKAARSNRILLQTASHIVGFQQPLAGTESLTRYCNELVAILTDTATSEKPAVVLERLVLLNVILNLPDQDVEGIAKQRLIFLVKHILTWLSEDVSIAIRAEVCKALAVLLPGMQEMYGEHWEQALGYILDCWASSRDASVDNIPDEGRILLDCSSLRLFTVLKRLSAAEEPNDDLVDALRDSDDRIAAGLLHLLNRANGASDETHTPLAITHELLARQVAQSPLKVVEEIDGMFPLLYAPSHAVQQAAFGILHRQIPAMQEQISFDAALDKKTARLPDELLSLVLETPTLDSLVDASFQRRMPPNLQGYLYSWRVIFDHFSGSSYKVKNDYIEQLKEGGYLAGLLDFTFDFLGHSRGKPVNASKFDIQEYSPDVEASPEKDVQWLLTHLYFLALTHLPSLVKSYYLDIRSRQTVVAVESWTAKYLSPMIVNASLSAVAEWAETSVKEDPEYEKMSVKVGMKSKEINVSYIVDEQTMAIRVDLPEAYPLESARVLGVSRVAVKEEKWQSWLRNCQGVITFSNGSITDGLSAWRKNVTGALKGQTECAICYSIISADRQLPTKRCPTCKNLFHSSCLFKWFRTSNASTCPLCRNPFNFN